MSHNIDLLLESFQTIARYAHPQSCIKDFIPAPPVGRMIVIGAGKASAAMAAAFEEHYQGDTDKLDGVVVTRYGHSVDTKHIKIMEAAHPVPDEAGMAAVDEMIGLIKTATEDDLIVCLISGGGSALLSAPVDGITFAELQALNKELLRSGAPIADMNTVRKHVNRALGGGLAQAAGGARMLTLAISDVTSDDPAVIASGATVADPSTLDDALAVIDRYGMDVPESVREALKREENETPKDHDHIFENKEYQLIATPRSALHEAERFWGEHGFMPYILGAEMEGDTNACAIKHVEFITKILSGEVDIKRPCAILSGGETTVTLRGNGQGGPNTQFMLQAAIMLKGDFHVYGMACDTDGIDGSADNAGAIITPHSLAEAAEAEIDPHDYLHDNDSYGFFDAIDGLVKTGPTYTNVNDYRVFLLLP